MVDGKSMVALAPQPLRVRTSPFDEVILLDDLGRAAGTARKCDVHGADTPFHLAISCYVVRRDGRLLITRRAASKQTWPGVWTNACCGHPRPGESLEDAVRRHLLDEIGLSPIRLSVALPDFAYRAMMDNGRIEHELCPVFVAEVAQDPELDPSEADALEWLTWTELQDRASSPPTADDPGLSPWSRVQIERMSRLTDDPLRWVREQRGISHHAMTRTRRTSDTLSRDPFAVMGREVDDLVEEFILGAEEQLLGFDPLATELSGPIRALFQAGGKRLRPCLVYCGFAAAGATDEIPGDRREDVASVAAAVEMLHTFALLHDDVMDRSGLRRGSPTAHVHFADLHRSECPNGDSDWFGASAALVAGDLAFVWADQLLDRIECEPRIARQVRQVYHTLRSEVIAGQYLDLRLAGPAATDHQSIVVALLKSGRYTVTRPLELGATLARAQPSTLAALRTYGDAVGVAFQLRDDVLGVFGDPTVTGKGVSDDISSGKASLLLVRSLELASPADRRVLLDCLGRAELDDDCIAECRRAIRASGAVASVEALIDSQLRIAERALDDLPTHAAEQLSTLSHVLAHRAA